MSTYATLTTSVESSRPIELVKIVQGVTTFFFTTAGFEIVSAGDTYVPLAGLEHDEIKLGGERDAALHLKMPAKTPFAAQWAVISPADSATVTIFQIEPDETPSPLQKVLFKGVVSAIKYLEGGLKADIAIRSIAAELQREIPRDTYQSSCNNHLYEPRCGASSLSHTFTGIVSDVTGDFVTVEGANASGMDFVAGHCKPTSVNDFRAIRSQSGDVIELSMPFPYSIVGLNVELAEGCDHLVAGHCRTRFGRVKDGFVGFAWVPEKNIFKTGLD